MVGLCLAGPMVSNCLAGQTRRSICSSLILPHLQYGLAAWGGCSNQSKKRIINIQKRAIRTISKSCITSHTEPRMKQMGIPRLNELYSQQCAMLVHDMIKNRAPSALNNFVSLETESNARNLRSHSADPLLVRIPPEKCKIITNSFCVKGAQVWNVIPQELRKVNEKHIFKYRMKQHFLDSYSETASCNNPRCTDRQHQH